VKVKLATNEMLNGKIGLRSRQGASDQAETAVRSGNIGAPWLKKNTVLSRGLEWKRGNQAPGGFARGETGGVGAEAFNYPRSRAARGF